MNPRLIPARELAVGPATVIFRLPGRKIRSRVELVVHEGDIVRVAFASGDILSLGARPWSGCSRHARLLRAGRGSRGERPPEALDGERAAAEIRQRLHALAYLSRLGVALAAGFVQLRPGPPPPPGPFASLGDLYRDLTPPPC